MVQVNNKEIIDMVLVFLLLGFNLCHTFSSDSIVDFEQVNVSCVS